MARAISPLVMPEVPPGSLPLHPSPCLNYRVMASISLTSLTTRGISTSLPSALHTR